MAVMMSWRKVESGAKGNGYAKALDWGREGGGRQNLQKVRDLVGSTVTPATTPRMHLQLGIQIHE
jgi:hypothetical protein